jgi:hypothetical protein
MAQGGRKPRAVRLARARFNIPAGETATVAVKLSAKARRRLRRVRRPRIEVRVTIVHPGGGAPGTAKRTFTVRRPRQR